MFANQGRNGRQIRSIFVSDLHLGCRFAHADAFLDFLEAHEPEQLYIVGDFIDGWKLKRSFRWEPAYNGIFKRLIQLAHQGTRVCYAPGNHDAFLREFLRNFGVVEIADEFVHETADHRRFLVIHGDRFDCFEMHYPWLSLIGSFAYDALLAANRLASRLKRVDPRRTYSFSNLVKRRIKALMEFFSAFEAKLVDHARQRNCRGVICGHIHEPAIRQAEGITYCNTGDWVENCTALVERKNGQLELLYYHDGQSEAEPAPADPAAEWDSFCDEELLFAGCLDAFDAPEPYAEALAR